VDYEWTDLHVLTLYPSAATVHDGMHMHAMSIMQYHATALSMTKAYIEKKFEACVT
jgi:hypothetical protein